MTSARSPSRTSAALRPWRKRHPVLSRTILYSLGLGVAVLLVVLVLSEKDEEARTGLEALQLELDGLGIVLATEPTGERLLAILDEKFSDDSQPVFLRARSLRWRAMAWRSRARTAEAEADREAGITAAEEALAACDALDLQPSERVALRLEWAEARLERADAEGALQVLPALGDVHGMAQALLRGLLLAQAERLQGSPERAAGLAVNLLAGLDGPALAGGSAHVGGRDWTSAQAAVELVNFVTAVAEAGQARARWAALRRALPLDYDVQVAAARGLARLNYDGDALVAWRAAQRLDARNAAAEVRRDPLLADLAARAAGE